VVLIDLVKAFLSAMVGHGWPWPIVGHGPWLSMVWARAKQMKKSMKKHKNTHHPYAHPLLRKHVLPNILELPAISNATTLRPHRRALEKGNH